MTKHERSGATLQDLRSAFLALRHSHSFTFWVVGSLAIGMAVAIAAFAFLITMLVGPFPGVTGQHRLVRVSLSENCGAPDCWRRMASPGDLLNIREGLTGLSGLAGYTAGPVTVALPEARSVRSVFATPDYFEVLGTRAAAGRVFGVGDEAGRAPVAVIAHKVWLRDFGGDPSAIGRTVRVANEFVQIVGVAPEFFVGVDLRPARGDRGPDVWLPLWLADRLLPLTIAEQRQQQRDLSFIGRLRDDVVLGQSMRMAVIGLIAGGVAALATSRVIQAEYHGIEGIDGTAFGGATMLFLAAMLLASGVPALRASRLDPVEILKDN